VRFLLTAALFVAFGAPALAQTAPASPYADPQPSISHPRKIVMSLSESAPARINEVIGNAGNIQKFYGADNVTIVLVVYGPGIRAVLKADSPVAARIAGLLAIGVEVEACGATLDTMHQGADALLPGVPVVPNGLPEIVERQVRGYYYVRP